MAVTAKAVFKSHSFDCLLLMLWRQSLQKIWGIWHTTSALLKYLRGYIPRHWRLCAGMETGPAPSKLLHCVSKNVPPLACYNFDTWTDFDIFGRNIIDKVRSRRLITMPPQVTCIVLLHYLVKRGNTKIVFFTQML